MNVEKDEYILTAFCQISAALCTNLGTNSMFFKAFKVHILSSFPKELIKLTEFVATKISKQKAGQSKNQGFNLALKLITVQ